MPARKNGKLSLKEKLFCVYYAFSGNATQSALKAGYAKKSAKLSGHKNITKYNLKKEIVRIQTEKQLGSEAEKQQIEQKLKEIAFTEKYSRTNYTKYATTVEFIENGKGKLIQRKTKIDRKSALDSLARINGMFEDNLNVKNKTQERLLDAIGEKRLRTVADSYIKEINKK